MHLELLLSHFCQVGCNSYHLLLLHHSYFGMLRFLLQTKCHNFFGQSWNLGTHPGILCNPEQHFVFSGSQHPFDVPSTEINPHCKTKSSWIIDLKLYYHNNRRAEPRVKSRGSRPCCLSILIHDFYYCKWK